MKMAELSRESGVPVATIKFYLREGLLTAGDRTQSNQAEYHEHHVKRLRLIRAMVGVAQTPIADVRDVLAAIDDPEVNAHSVFGVAQRGVMPKAGLRAEGPLPERLERLAVQRNWTDTEDNPAWQAAASVLRSYDELGADDITSVLDAYAEAAEIVARADIAAIAARKGLVNQVEGVLLGTALGDVLFASLRRIAQEHVSAQQFPT
ncbi:MerR family transcriptional regulator [Smaragdicoccus niigatensis]|uniref:MerR family transcriptional regulator n=1 Tax=Smaragdicoccus niigatensis TaxID=359359 RepID=UPI0003782CE3|nr:MerR family transcriptional regulator [Smaragdicoccus niigatensis]